MSRRSLMLSCAIGATTALWGFAAWAQPNNQTQTTADPNVTVVDDVIVTAEGRQVSVQDIPVAISAYTSAERDRLGILSIQDLTNFTPGFAYSSTTDRPSIRGISRLTNNFAVDNGVATYSDGVWTNSTLAAASTPLMVQRTEILRGPQGTLYGRNSIGGAINVLSRRPTEEMYAEVRATLATYDYMNLQAAISGPLTDDIGFRVLALYTNQHDGFSTNVADGTTEGGRGENFYFEAQLSATFGDFDAWFKINSFTFDDYGRAGYSLGNYDTALFPTGSLGPGNGVGFTLPSLVQLGNVTTNPQVNDHRTFNVNTPTNNRLRDNLGMTLHLTWNASGFDVRYVGGYQTYYYQGISDFDGTPVISYNYPGTTTPIFPSAIFDYIEDRQWWSNEVTFVSTGDGPLQWIAGVFQYREDYEQPFYIHTPQPQVRTPYYTGFCGFFTDSFCTGAPTPVLAPPQADGSVYLVNTLGDATSYAVFAQFDYDLTDQFHITAGLRHTWDEKNVLESERLICFGNFNFGCPPINGTIFGLFSPSIPIAQDLTPATSPAAPGATAGVRDPVTGQLRRNLAGEWSAFTGTFGLQWEPSDDTLAYFRYSRGYKAGGFNTGAAAPFAALPQVNEETVDAYEIGIKQEFGTFATINVSAFFYNYRGAQAPFTVVPNVGPAFTQFINIPSSHNMGVEVETTWRPMDNLQIIANYAYLSAEIQDGGGCFTDSLDPTAALPTAQPTGCVGGGQRIEGRQLPAVTPHKVALNANYTWDLDAGYLTGSVSWIWKDSTPYSFFGNPNTYAPAYSQTDVRLSFNSRDGHYTLTAFGRNVFDDEGYESASGTRQTSGVVVRNFVITPPRTYGVELQYRF